MTVYVVLVIFTEESDDGMKGTLALALGLNAVFVTYKQQVDRFFNFSVLLCIRHD